MTTQNKGSSISHHFWHLWGPVQMRDPLLPWSREEGFAFNTESWVQAMPFTVLGEKPAGAKSHPRDRQGNCPLQPTELCCSPGTLLAREISPPRQSTLNDGVYFFCRMLQHSAICLSWHFLQKEMLVRRKKKKNNSFTAVSIYPLL